MKMKRLIIVGLSLLAAQCFSQSIIRDGLVFDSNNKAPNGKNLGVDSAAGIHEKTSPALRFGGNDYVTYGDTLDMGRGDFSISLWYNTSSYPTEATGSKLVNKGITTSGTPTLSGWGVRLINESGENIVRFIVRGTGESAYDACSAGGMKLNEWTNIVCVKKSTKIYIYVNGQVKDSSTCTTASLDTDMPLSLGALCRTPVGMTSEFFTGLLDDVKLYNKALSNEEIETLHQYFLVGPDISMSGQFAELSNMEGSSDSITIYSNTPWAIKSTAPWFDVTPVSGAGRGKLIITAKSVNPSDEKEREDTVFIYGADTLFFTVEQARIILRGNPAFVDITNQEGVEIIGNCTWTASANKPWIKLDKTSGMGTDSLIIKVNGPVASGDKTGTVTLTSGSITSEILVTYTGTTGNPEVEKIDISINQSSIKVSNCPESSVFSVVSANGTSVINQKSSSSSCTIDISQLPSATYFLNFNNNMIRAFVK